jgi:hypothetical protein
VSDPFYKRGLTNRRGIRDKESRLTFSPSRVTILNQVTRLITCQTMKKNSYTGYDLLLGGLFMALAVVFPVFFHVIGLGSSFLPMFYPIITAGFLVALPAAAVVGILSPLVSALLTGMPPFYPPIAFIMMAEGLVIASLPAILYRNRRIKLNPWITVILTMMADRLVLLACVPVLSRLLDLPPGMLTFAALIKGIPGIIMMIVIIPPLVKIMESKTRLTRMLE